MKHSLDRKMDRILERENSGRIKKGIRNRALRKLFANRLSVLGFIIFIVILVMCLGAPLFTQYSATKVDLRNIKPAHVFPHIWDRQDRKGHMGQNPLRRPYFHRRGAGKRPCGHSPGCIAGDYGRL